MDVTEELAHLLGTVAPRKAAQPRNVWLLHARFQHGACHRRDQIARRQLRRLVSDREHLTTRLPVACWRAKILRQHAIGTVSQSRVSAEAE